MAEEEWILRVEAVVLQKSFLFLEKDLPEGEEEENWKNRLKIIHLPFGGNERGKAQGFGANWLLRERDFS